LISSKISGTKILDVGCGYGSLVNFLTELDLMVEGIDHNEHSVEIAETLFPSARVRLSGAEYLDESRYGTYDTVVLKDCLHHLVGEGDLDRSFKGIRRMLKDNGRLVIFDPNPILLLRLGRKLIFHRDTEVTLALALTILEKHKFRIKEVSFYELIGLPLSGGYVGVRFVPNMKFLNSTIAFLNDLLSKAINTIGLGRYFLLRYLICADKI
jgi:SAM-dependent methyltransferase